MKESKAQSKYSFKKLMIVLSSVLGFFILGPIILINMGHHLVSGFVNFLRYDPDISGKIIDAETHTPIKGVVVSAYWYTEYMRPPIEPGWKFYDNYESMTDKKGTFYIPGKGLNIIRNMYPPNITIFKSDYPFVDLRDLGEDFKKYEKDLRLYEAIVWEDDKVIISYKKSERSFAERKKDLPSPPRTEIPYQKIKLYLAELEKEFEAVGAKPYFMYNWKDRLPQETQ